MWSRLGDAYHNTIVVHGKQPLFLLLLSFLVTFGFIRLSVRMIRAQVRWWPGNVSAGGTHVHHVVFGTVFMLLAGVGVFAPAGRATPWREVCAVIFGAGAALVLDEFALILHVQDVYWSERGRTSVDAVVLSAAALGMLVLGVVPLGTDTAAGAAATRESVVVTAVLNGCLVVVTFLKGKLWTGFFGILVTPLALVGAIRLARPHSPWARWRYLRRPRKLAHSARREDRVQRWLRRKDRLQDIIAGRPDQPSVTGGERGD